MVQDELGLEPGKGRLVGTISGGLLGLVGGPASVVVGAFVGAGAGDLAAKVTHQGFSDEFLDGLEECLQPGIAALVVLAEQRWTQKVLESLAGEEGAILQETLTDELVKQLVRGNVEGS